MSGASIHPRATALEQEKGARNLPGEGHGNSLELRAEGDRTQVISPGQNLKLG